MIIVFDPGHSGPVEPGACGGGLTEAASVVDIALQAVPMLEANGHQVTLTRTGDISSDGLAWRAELANAIHADLFISIHANAAASCDAHGTEVYHYPGSYAGAQLAACICASIVSGCGTVDRGVKAADFAVLRLTNMPAVLVETAFISNLTDRCILASQAGRYVLARCLAAGVQKYLHS